MGQCIDLMGFQNLFLLWKGDHFNVIKMINLQTMSNIQKGTEITGAHTYIHIYIYIYIYISEFQSFDDFFLIKK